MARCTEGVSLGCFRGLRHKDGSNNYQSDPFPMRGKMREDRRNIIMRLPLPFIFPRRTSFSLRLPCLLFNIILVRGYSRSVDNNAKLSLFNCNCTLFNKKSEQHFIKSITKNYACTLFNKKREQRSIKSIIKNYLISKYNIGCALSLSATEFNLVLPYNAKSKRKLAASK